MSIFGFNESKFKAQLKMAIQRIKLVNNKIENECKRLKREIAGLLNKPQKEEEKAKIKCEHLIRGDHTVAAHTILELMCEALIARIKLISATKKCPEDLLSAVSTVIYCASRVDIPELKKIRKMLQSRYGKDIIQQATNNSGYNVNTTVIAKLNISEPKEGMVRNYLTAIAEEYQFEWEPQEEKDAMGLSEAPIGRDINHAAATGFTNNYGPDGAPLINSYNTGTGMLPAPGQIAQPQQPQQPQYNPYGQQPPQQQFGQPQYAPQPQQNYAQPMQQQPQMGYSQSQPAVQAAGIGTFGANPRSAQHATAHHSPDHTACPTCGSMVDPAQIKAHRNNAIANAPTPNQYPQLPGPPNGSQPPANYQPTFGTAQSTSPSLSPAPSPMAAPAGSPAVDSFGIPIAPSSAVGGQPGLEDDELPPPPPSGPVYANSPQQNNDTPGIDELESRFNDLLK